MWRGRKAPSSASGLLPCLLSANEQQVPSGFAGPWDSQARELPRRFPAREKVTDPRFGAAPGGSQADARATFSPATSQPKPAETDGT